MYESGWRRQAVHILYIQTIINRQLIKIQIDQNLLDLGFFSRVGIATLGGSTQDQQTHKEW